MEKRERTGRRRRKLPLAMGLVSGFVVIAAAAGIGFTVWHEQPGFCNAICHQPMDAYVAGYESDATSLIAAHRAEQVNCLGCHKNSLNEQLAEASSWVQGSYQLREDGMLATVGVTADTKQCATSGCHNMDEVIAATESWGGEAGVNPHQSHQGTAIDCSNCHSAHEDSYLFCNTCHDYELPDGWVDPKSPQ